MCIGSQKEGCVTPMAADTVEVDSCIYQDCATSGRDKRGCREASRRDLERRERQLVMRVRSVGNCEDYCALYRRFLDL